MRKFILSIVLLAAAQPAFCGTSYGQVQNYLVSRSGKLFFFTGTTEGGPACGGSGHWAVDLTGANAAGGKAILAAVISAYVTGKPVRVIGVGNCDVWGDRESVDYIVSE